MPKVFLSSAPRYEENIIRTQISEGMNLLGGFERFVKPGDNIFLKLNLLMKKHPEEGVTTHPKVVLAVVRELMNLGAKVTIGDSPGGPFTVRSLKNIYKSSGIEEVAELTGASLNYDVSETNVHFDEGKVLSHLTLCKAMVDADKIICISKLKTHQMMRYTGAVKLLFGAIPGLKKAEYHLRMPDINDFADMLLDIVLCTKPVLHIMDAIVGMEGHGPSAGKLRDVGKILISEDPFYLDVVAAKLVGIDPESIPTIKRAKKRNLYNEELEIIGEELKPVEPSFVVPEISGDVNFPVPGFLNNYLRPRPVFNPKICVGCGECVRACPPKALTLKNKFPEVDLNKCIRCFCCQELCPKKAIKVKRSLLGRLLK